MLALSWRNMCSVLWHHNSQHFVSQRRHTNHRFHDYEYIERLLRSAARCCTEKHLKRKGNPDGSLLQLFEYLVPLLYAIVIQLLSLLYLLCVLPSACLSSLSAGMSFLPSTPDVCSLHRAGSTTSAGPQPRLHLSTLLPHYQFHRSLRLHRD